MKTAQNVGALALSAVLTTALTCGMGVALTQAAVASVADQFPDQSLSTIMQIVTLPNLVLVPVIVAAGIVAGRRIGFRSLILIGMSLVLVGGLLPVVFEGQWSVVMVGTVLRGVGLGLQMSMGVTLAMALWTGTKSRTYVGWAEGAQCLGAMVAQLLGGFLVDAGVNPWLGYLVIIPGLLLVAFGLPEPPKSGGTEMESGAARRLPFVGYLLAISTLPVMMVCIVPILVMSSIIVDEGISNASGAGLALAMFTFFGFLSGLAFGSTVKVLGRYSSGAGPVFAMLGLFVIYMASSLPAMMAGMALVGFGYYIILISVLTLMGEVVSKECVAFGLSLAIASANVGSFLGPFFISAVQNFFGHVDDLRFPILCAALCCVPIMFVLSFWDPAKKGNEDSSRKVKAGANKNDSVPATVETITGKEQGPA